MAKSPLIKLSNHRGKAKPDDTGKRGKISPTEKDFADFF